MARGRWSLLSYMTARLQAFRVKAGDMLSWGRDGAASLARREAATYPDLYTRYSTDIAHVLQLWVAGVRASGGRVRWKPRWAVFLALISIVPILTAAFLDLRLGHHPPRGTSFTYYGWLSYFSGLTWIEIIFGLGGVTVFHNLTSPLEKMLTQRGRNTYDRWADIATAPLPQAAFSVVFSVAACCALWIISLTPGISRHLYVSTPSYMSLGFCSLFIAQGAYWIVSGTLLSILLTRPGHMTVDWYAPALTPGMELLARCYRLAFYGSSLGVAFCLFPVLAWAYKAPGTTLFLAVKVGLFIISVLAPLSIAVVPQWRLSSVVAQERRAAIEYLRALLPASASSVVPPGPSDSTNLAWLQTVISSPASTVKDSTVVGILLGVSTAVLPYLINFLA